jgi:hypothetical protein
VWRSRSKVRELNLNEAEFERGVEFRRNQTKDSKFKSACGVKTRSIKSR